jgi:hypothetical protein
MVKKKPWKRVLLGESTIGIVVLVTESLGFVIQL